MVALLALALTSYYIAQPPPQYDHPYRGRHHIIWMDDYALQAVCHYPGAAACTGRFRDGCRTYISKSWAPYQQPILRHETAHCNGWSGAHEGAQ